VIPLTGGALVATLAAATVATSLLSGVLGMAGGTLLMAVMAWLLPVGAAMVLHGLAQATANGWRAWLNRRGVDLKVLKGWLAGALACLLIFAGLEVTPPPALVYLLLGLMPIAARLVPRFRLDITRPEQAMACGFLVTVLQLLSGVSGPLLDMFFVETRLGRHAVVGTKAVTQTAAHLLKLLYFGVLLDDLGSPDLPAWLLATVVAAAILGTSLGKRVLDGLTDERFRALSRAVILAIGLGCLGRSAWLMAAG
jgi:uncharacterized membrane protein YfcA